MTCVSHDSLATVGHEIRLAHFFILLDLSLTSLFDGLILFGQELILGAIEGLAGSLFELLVVQFFGVTGNLDSWAEGAFLHFLVGFFLLEFHRVLLQFVLFVFLSFGQSLLSLNIYLA